MAIFDRQADDRYDQQAEVIDLVALERTRDLRSGKIQWGLPAPCPDCGAAGYLDHIDLVNRVMTQHCPKCGERWMIAEADIEAAQHLL